MSDDSAGPLGIGASAGGRLALTVLVAIVLLLPDRLTFGPGWILPVVVGVLLVGIAVADPGRIDKRSNAIRGGWIAVLVMLALAAGWATERLIAELIEVERSPSRRRHS